MIKTINLNRLSDDVLNKTILEVINPEIKDYRKIIETNSNSYFKIATKKSIIFGKLNSFDDNNIISYTGYYISQTAIRKAKNEKTVIDDADISIITEDKFNDISKEIEEILFEINNISVELLEKCNSEDSVKIPKIIGFEKPNKDELLTFKVDNDFIRRFGNKKLKDLLTESLQAYNKLLDGYKEAYHENKKLLGKYFITPNMIGNITDMSENSCNLYATNVMKFETNKLTSYLPLDVSYISNMFEAPYKLFQRGQDIMINVKTLYTKYLHIWNKTCIFAMWLKMVGNINWQ